VEYTKNVTLAELACWGYSWRIMSCMRAVSPPFSWELMLDCCWCQWFCESNNSGCTLYGWPVHQLVNKYNSKAVIVHLKERKKAASCNVLQGLWQLAWFRHFSESRDPVVANSSGQHFQLLSHNSPTQKKAECGSLCIHDRCRKFSLRHVMYMYRDDQLILRALL